MNKKIYLHFEHEGLEPFTKSVWVGVNDSFNDILQIFLNNYQSHTMDAKYLILKDSHGNELRGNIYEKLEAKKDYFIQYNGNHTDTISPQRNNINNTSIQQNNDVITQTNETIFKGTSTPKSLELAQGLYAKKSYREAREICEQNISDEHPQFLELLCRIDIATRRLASAIKHAKLLVKTCPVQYRCTSYLTYAEVFVESGEYDEALEGYTHALDYYPETSSKKSNLIIDIQAGMVECLFYLGHHNEAVTKLNQLLSLNDTNNNLKALLTYSRFAFSYSKINEAMQSLLKAIALDAKNKKVFKLFALVFATAQHVDTLYQHVIPSKTTYAAYSLLISIAKDCSCLETCEVLLDKMIEVNTSQGKDNILTVSNDVLLQIHIYEISLQYHKIQSKMLWYLNSVMSSGMTSIGNDGYKLDILQLISLIEALDLNEEGCHVKSPNISVPIFKVHVTETIKNNDINNYHLSSSYTLPHSIDFMRRNYHTLDYASLPKITYSKEILDIIAMCFTLVKILFLYGRITEVVYLIDMLEPLRRLSNVQLHETLIRNEHAYYLCISQIIAATFGIEYSESCMDCNSVNSTNIHSNTINENLSPIYVIGDSHCLSSAWQKICVDNTTGEQRILVPKLVTGLKHWHLHEDSMFYPKENFNRAINSIPDGSTVK
jgi:tetratricopeptide (TPR) repeat protein